MKKEGSDSTLLVKILDMISHCPDQFASHPQLIKTCTCLIGELAYLVTTTVHLWIPLLSYLMAAIQVTESSDSSCIALRNVLIRIGGSVDDASWEKVLNTRFRWSLAHFLQREELL